MKKVRTSIRVGQRLIRWDGEKGYVALNSRGIRSYSEVEAFMIEWRDHESEYATLDQFEEEGIQLGLGVMPWVC